MTISRKELQPPIAILLPQGGKAQDLLASLSAKRSKSKAPVSEETHAQIQKYRAEERLVSQSSWSRPPPQRLLFRNMEGPKIIETTGLLDEIIDSCKIEQINFKIHHAQTVQLVIASSSLFTAAWPVNRQLVRLRRLCEFALIK